MKITINKEFNELHATLSSFVILSNYDYFKIQMEEKWNMKLDNETEENTKILLRNPIFHKAQYLVNMELQTKNIFINPKFIDKSKDLDEYFKFLRDESEEELRKAIFNTLEFEESYKYENNIGAILEDIDKIDCNGNMKWYLISFIKDPKLYIEKFIELIREYLPLYEELKKKYWKDYMEFTQWIDKKLYKHGIDFIDENLNFVNLKQYDEVCVNYSLFELISIHGFEEGKVNIFIGLTFKRYIEEQENKNDIDKHLNVYKVLSDKTRFDIIRILLEKESYGQEIAERLGITTATISYHMDFLFSASLIFINRKSRRLYYSVNKDQIKSSVDFLKREIRL